MTEEILTQTVSALAPVLATLITTALTWAAAEAARRIRRRTKDETINNAMARVVHMTETTVAEINQQFADDLRAAAADGRISTKDRHTLKDRAITRVKRRLTPEVLDIAAKGVVDLNQFIAARIERAVREQKQAQAGVGLPILEPLAEVAS